MQFNHTRTNLVNHRGHLGKLLLHRYGGQVMRNITVKDARLLDNNMPLIAEIAGTNDFTHKLSRCLFHEFQLAISEILLEFLGYLSKIYRTALNILHSVGSDFCLTKNAGQRFRDVLAVYRGKPFCNLVTGGSRKSFIIRASRLDKLVLRQMIIAGHVSAPHKQ